MCDYKVIGKRIVSGQFLFFRTRLSVFVNAYSVPKADGGEKWRPELRAYSDKGKLSGRRYHPFSLSKPFEREKTPQYFFYPMLPDFQKNTAFIRFPSFARLPF